MGTIVTMPVVNARGNKNFRNQKFYNHSFANQDLAHADFRCASLIGCSFEHADLSYANFEGANCRCADFTATRCYRTNFKDAALAGSKFAPSDAFGMTFSFTCEMFEGMQVAPLWWYMFLMNLLLMKAPTEEMELDVIKIIGPERYAGLKTLMARRAL